MSTLLKLLTSVSDKLSTPDGARGAAYVIAGIAGAAGYGGYVTPQTSALIVSVIMGLSGLVHLWVTPPTTAVPSPTFSTPTPPAK